MAGAGPWTGAQLTGWRADVRPSRRTPVKGASEAADQLAKPILFSPPIHPLVMFRMPIDLRNLRVPARPLSLLGAAALAAGLLLPGAAPAGQSRPAPHAVAHERAAHGRIARDRCVIKRRKRSSDGRSSSSRSSSRRRASRGCLAKRAARHRGQGAKRPSQTPPNPTPGPAPGVAPPAPVSGSSQGPISPTPASESASPGDAGASPSEYSAEGDPIDPKYLTEMPFGSTSFWIQPWRAYLDTWPASRLIESLGINFDVHPAQAEGTAQLLQDSGFKLARIGINWDALSYGEPTQFTNEAGIRTRLLALQRHGLRPLILLDANSTGPAPSENVTLTTLSSAQAGAQTVTLTPASAAQVVPGKTGFDRLSFGGSPDILITSVTPTGLATLSRPLPSALPAGEHKGTTLLYAPFSQPTLPNGEPNPAFRETLDGWLSYVGAVCKLAAGIFGAGGYDLEVWNELSFGSQFLNSEHYYSSGDEEKETEAEESPNAEESPEEGSSKALESSEEAEGEGEGEEPALSKKQVNKEIRQALLGETVAYVRDLSPGVGVSDGFASQTPFPSGENVPAGLTALSKHLYNGPKMFSAAYKERHIKVLNALGEQDTSSAKSFKPLFVPSYQSLFPEYYLTGVQTATIVRDLAPITTHIYKTPHGRAVGPEGGTPPQVWMTEYNLNPAKATVVGPDETTPATGSSAQLTAADKAHFQAKALLRSLVAMVSKGMTREYFFHAGPGAFDLIGEGFTQALEANPGTYPGDALGGETMTGFRNMLAQFQGPGPTAEPRQLKLLSITQDGEHAQFTGDGTTAHPSLYDREVLAVFPFQSSPTRFVIPVYVMTRDLATLYEPNAPQTDIHRFDLPNETFRITLGNLPETTTPPTISAYDPLRNETTPTQLITRTSNTATIEIAATDYPRILTLNYTGK